MHVSHSGYILAGFEREWKTSASCSERAIMGFGNMWQNILLWILRL